jgi:hypothetical protein
MSFANSKDGVATQPFLVAGTKAQIFLIFYYIFTAVFLAGDPHHLAKILCADFVFFKNNFILDSISDFYKWTAKIKFELLALIPQPFSLFCSIQ